MAVTVQQVVDATIIELSQVPGTSTQVYATPRIMRYVQNTFEFCFEAAWWNVYTGWYTGILDGTTGRLVGDMVPTGLPSTTQAIRHYIDIGDVFVGGTSQKVYPLPRGINPDTVTSSTAGAPQFRAPDMVNANSPIRFFPLTSAGTMTLQVRQRPQNPFALTDTLYLDALMLVLGAAYMYAADDGTNPGQINKFQSMFMKRLNDMIAAEGAVSVALDSRYGTSTDQWWER